MAIKHTVRPRPYSFEKVGQPNFVTLQGTDGISSATELDHNVAA